MESQGSKGLVETNRNLSSAVDKFELRHKQLECKICVSESRVGMENVSDADDASDP